MLEKILWKDQIKMEYGSIRNQKMQKNKLMRPFNTAGVGAQMLTSYSNG